MFSWKRYGGYEASSKGDKRFSAFNAYLEDGRSIEVHYQCDIKGHCPGSNNWRAGKGKPPVDKSKDLYTEYLALWNQWAKDHPELMAELKAQALKHGGILSDRFASTPVNQARALSDVLNSLARSSRAT